MKRWSGSEPSRPRLIRAWLSLLLLAGCLLFQGSPSWAAPVDWQELPSTPEGRQWWDAGSLRVNREGHLTVLSRFQPAVDELPATESVAATPAASGGNPAARAATGGLYVMEIDCDQNLFRDTSVNGIPRWRAEWQPSGGDDLISEVVSTVCGLGADQRISASR